MVMGELIIMRRILLAKVVAMMSDVVTSIEMVQMIEMVVADITLTSVADAILKRTSDTNGAYAKFSM
jgi:hypothetical protein